MSKIDALFNEKKQKIPDEVIKEIKDIIERNDKIGPRSNHRVSLERTIRWLEQEMGCKLTAKQIQTISRNELGRKSWAHE